MPTDPFVPSELADRPRQQQNLPPGLAPPPAQIGAPIAPETRTARPSWERCSGVRAPTSVTRTPSPPACRDRLRLSPIEHDDDAMAVIAEIAGKRAAQFGRAPVMADIDCAIALLGYDGLADDKFVETRARLVHDAAHDYIRRRELVDAVPEAMLSLKLADLVKVVDDWRSALADNVVSQHGNAPA